VNGVEQKGFEASHECFARDLLFVSGFDASIGKSLTGGLRGIDIHVSSWGVFIGLLGEKNKHIILAQNNFRYGNGLYELKFKMHQAVGTSTAMMIFTSIGGVISYMIEGIGVSGLPEYSIGYVNLLQWILLAGTSVPMAQVGVRTAHKIPGKQLKYVFIVVMVYMGLKMIGVFSWLHLPI